MKGVVYLRCNIFKKLNEPTLLIVYSLKTCLPFYKFRAEFCTRKDSFPDGSFVSLRTLLALNT